MQALQGVHDLLLGSVPAEELKGYAERLLLLGHAFWLVTYALIGAQMFRDRLLGIPLAAIFLNISWEGLIYANCPGVAAGALCQPYVSGEWSLALALTLALDAMLLAQAFAIVSVRYGKLATAGLFAVALYVSFRMHATFIGMALDYRGLVSAWIINVVASSAFVWLAYRRARGEGLSLPAGYAKLAGNFLVGAGVFAYPPAYGLVFDARTITVAVLVVAVAALDVWYIVLLSRRLGQKEALPS